MTADEPIPVVMAAEGKDMTPFVVLATGTNVDVSEPGSVPRNGGKEVPACPVSFIPDSPL